MLIPTTSRLSPCFLPVLSVRKLFVPLPTLGSAQPFGGEPQRGFYSNSFSFMAKSKSGGTRSYIRGRVGADVYSIGKDAKGKKQQVVRSLAESVANPQTISQMRGRMIMSTIMQALSELKPVVDHSFDSVQGVQPNLSEFISRNYGLVKQDIAANTVGGNAFGLNMYKEKGAKRGAYVVAAGTAVLPAVVSFDPGAAVITIAVGSDTQTVAQLKDVTGLSSNDFLTIVGISEEGKAVYCRARIASAVADTTALTSQNLPAIIALEGNKLASVALADGSITITLKDAAGNSAVIISRSVNGGFIHNNAQLSVPAEPQFPSVTALPTYPVGEQKFLNGGDIFGLSENAAETGSTGSGSGSGGSGSGGGASGDSPAGD